MGSVAGSLWTYRTPDGSDEVVPHYSTSWADAGPLLEEMAERGGFFVGVQGLAEGGDWVAYCEAKSEHREFEVRCPAGPEAVALAYCIAKERE